MIARAFVAELSRRRTPSQLLHPGNAASNSHRGSATLPAIQPKASGLGCLVAFAVAAASRVATDLRSHLRFHSSHPCHLWERGRRTEFARARGKPAVAGHKELVEGHVKLIAAMPRLMQLAKPCLAPAAGQLVMACTGISALQFSRPGHVLILDAPWTSSRSGAAAESNTRPLVRQGEVAESPRTKGW